MGLTSLENGSGRILLWSLLSYYLEHLLSIVRNVGDYFFVLYSRASVLWVSRVGAQRRTLPIFQTSSGRIKHGVKLIDNRNLPESTFKNSYSKSRLGQDSIVHLNMDSKSVLEVED